MPGNGDFSFHADETDRGERLDVVIARHLPDCSRSMAADLIRRQRVTVCQTARKAGYRVRTDDEIQGSLPAPSIVDCRPEPIDLDIRFEDDQLLVVNKQPGMVVHPAPGHSSGTLVNAVLHHCPEIRRQGDTRPGIVHRLDKDTSGTLIVAKTISAHHHLSGQFKSRDIGKTYLAIVCGNPETREGAITLPIGRHPVDRKRMSAMTGVRGRHAETRWRVRETFPGASLLEIDLKTGRTHQIRVHCAAAGHPVVGDEVYGKKAARTHPSRGLDTAAVLSRAPRQMLHAWRLTFGHPRTGRIITVESPLPEDMSNLLDALRALV